MKRETLVKMLESRSQPAGPIEWLPIDDQHEEELHGVTDLGSDQVCCEGRSSPSGKRELCRQIKDSIPQLRLSNFLQRYRAFTMSKLIFAVVLVALVACVSATFYAGYGGYGRRYGYGYGVGIGGVGVGFGTYGYEAPRPYYGSYGYSRPIYGGYSSYGYGYPAYGGIPYVY